MSHITLKNAFVQIKNDLKICLKHSKASDKWISVNWLYQTIEYLNYAIIELDKITSKYEVLYKDKDPLISGSYLVEKYQDIVFYSQSFFEGVFVYYKGITDKNGLNSLSPQYFSAKFKEMDYVRKVRNIFIVHPSEFFMSFYSGVSTTPTENILFSRFSGSRKATENDTEMWYKEVFDKSSSHQYIVTENEFILLSIKQKILDTRPELFFESLTEKELQYLRLKGVPNFNQNQFSKDIMSLHKEILKNLTYKST